MITIDTKTALTGEDVLHITNARAIDGQTGQDLTNKLLVNMANVQLGQVGMYDASLAVVDENGNLQPLRQITIKITADDANAAGFAQQTRRQQAPAQPEPQRFQQHPQSVVQDQQPRKKKKGWGKKIFYIILAFLAIYLVWTGISYYHTRQQVADQGSQIAELQRKNDSLGDQLDTANTQIKELRQNYKKTKNAVKEYKKNEGTYRQQYLTQMQQVSQNLATLKQQLDTQTQQNGMIYSLINGRLDNLQTTVNQMVSAQSAAQAQRVLNNYHWWES